MTLEYIAIVLVPQKITIEANSLEMAATEAVNFVAKLKAVNTYGPKLLHVGLEDLDPNWIPKEEPPPPEAA